MFRAMKSDRLPIQDIPRRDIPLEVLVQKLEWCLSGLCLLTIAILPMRAIAQITEPLLPLLPAPTLPTAPQAPAVTSPTTSAGETVTSRAQPEFAPLGLHLGEFFWFPRAELDESYNSNIFATTTSPTTDWITAVSPSFDLLSIFPSSGLNLHGGATFQDFASHPTQNTATGTASADGRLDVTSGSSLYANALVSHPYISYGSPTSPMGIAEPVTYWNYIARAGYTQGGQRITYGIDGGVAAAQYNAAPLVGGGISPQSSQNSLVSDAALHAGYEIVPDYLGYIRFDAAHYNYLRAPSANSTTYRFDLGLQILPRHIIFGNVYAGYLVQNYASLASTPFPDYGGELVWTVTTLTTLTFDGLRTFYTGTPVTTPTLVSGPAGNGYLASSVGARADHELLRNLLLTVNATYELDNFQGITRTDNVYGAGAGVTYMVNRYLFFGGTFSYYRRNSTYPDSSYAQDIVMLRVGTQF
jgi:hypothetical protein